MHSQVELHAVGCMPLDALHVDKAKCLYVSYAAEVVHSHTGAKKTKLETFIREFLTEDEAAVTQPLYL